MATLSWVCEKIAPVELQTAEKVSLILGTTQDTSIKDEVGIA